MQWKFVISDPNGINLKDASKQTTQSSELSDLQIFVREILQNALDNNSTDDTPVRVSFEITYLLGDEKRRFLEELRWDQLAPHLHASRERMIKKRGGSNLSPPKEISDPDIPLKLLHIHDDDTKGLIGAETPVEAEETQGPHCFVGLCRNIGDNQKDGDTSGGTNGFGKTVLWKASRMGTVLFYSRLKNPYKNHTRRFFGQTRLEAYFIDKTPCSGVGYCGVPHNNLTNSMYDEDADNKAKKLLFKERGEGQYGTSMLIVDFDDPDCDDNIEQPETTATAMISAAEEYFWPAIIDGRLSVRCGYEENETKEWIDAGPHNRKELASFIKAYQAIKGNRAKEDYIAVDCFDVTIPAGPSQYEYDANAKIFIGIKKEMEESSGDKYRNRTALIRGAGMVVGYAKTTRAIGGEEFSAVVVAGRACPGEDNSNKRSEKLLAYSEPVTHDTWKPDSDNIKACGWRGATSAVRKIVNGYKDIIAKRTGRETKPTGEAAPILANLLALTQGDAGVSDRDIHINNIAGPSKVYDGAHYKGIFSFSVRVPAKDDFKAATKPKKWRLKCTYGFIGEGGRHGSKVKSLNMPISIVSATINGLDLKLESSYAPEINYEGDVTDKVQMFTINGESQILSGLIVDASRHELTIRVDKGYDE